MAEKLPIFSSQRKSSEQEATTENHPIPDFSQYHLSLSQPCEVFHPQKQLLESERFNALRKYLTSQLSQQHVHENTSASTNSHFKSSETKQSSDELTEFRNSDPARVSDAKLSVLQKCDALNLLYDFYRQSFKFSADELLKNEPTPEYSWIHACCAFWNPEIPRSENFDNLDLSAFGQIDKKRFTALCIVCNSSHGAVISCSGSNCEERFHAECARRAKLHFEIQHDSELKFHAFCPKHTTLPFKAMLDSQDQKSREEISRFQKSLKRFLKSYRLFPDNPSKRAMAFESMRLEIQREKPSPLDKIIFRKQSTRSSAHQKPDTLPLEHMIKHLPFEYKYFLRYFRDEIEPEQKYTFHVNLRLDKDKKYQVRNVTQPKNIFVDELCRDNEVWRRLADSLQITAKAAHKRYQNLIQQLTTLAGSHQLFISTAANNPLDNSQSSPMLSLGTKQEIKDSGNFNIGLKSLGRFNCLSMESITADSQNNQSIIGCQNCGKQFHKSCKDCWFSDFSTGPNHVSCLNCLHRDRSAWDRITVGRPKQSPSVKHSRLKKDALGDHELDMKTFISKFLDDKDCFQIDCFLHSTQPQLFSDGNNTSVMVRPEPKNDSIVEIHLTPEAISVSIPICRATNSYYESLDAENMEDSEAPGNLCSLPEGQSSPDAHSEMLVEEECPKVTS